MPNAKAEVPQRVPGSRLKGRDTFARTRTTIVAPFLFHRQGTEGIRLPFWPGSYDHGAAPDICKIAQTVAAQDDATPKAPVRFQDDVAESRRQDLGKMVAARDAGERCARLEGRSLQERSSRRETSAYRSALSMLTFYINRAGRNLPKTDRDRLERAKAELKRQFGRD